MAKTRSLAETERARWIRALEQIANEYPKDSREYKLFGTLAWGRYDGEPSPSEHKEDVFFGLGFLQGFRYASLIAAEVLKLPTEDALRSIHRRIEMYGR